ncbi:MAG: (Fe-S)-binding protein [Alphaproteobacteria bacterium]|nr:(Fe-S)-binding protein [Alphaproteobacteria bacterium]
MPVSSPRIRVGLFVTCLVDLIRPQVGFAAVRLLEDAGCEVVVPRRQTCCGQPAYNSGDRKNAAALVRQTMETFEHVDYVVVPSGSCAAILRLHAPALLADPPELADRVKAFSEKVHELTAFLKDVLGVTCLPGTSGKAKARDVVYHDSCAGLRELGIREAPRDLLGELPGLTLRELDERDVCCGFGGTFCVKFPEISERLATDKAGAAEAAGAGELIGGDLGCLLHLAGSLRNRGSKLRVRHVAEVLAGLDDGPAIGEPVED